MANRKYLGTALRFTLLSVLLALYLGAIHECKIAKAAGLLKVDQKPKPGICKCEKVTPRLWKCDCTDMNFFSEKQCLNSCHINATTTKPKPDESCQCAKVSTSRLWKCNCTDINFSIEKQCLNSCHINANTTKPEPDESCKCVKVTPLVWKCNCTDMNFFSEKQCLNSCHVNATTTKADECGPQGDKVYSPSLEVQLNRHEVFKRTEMPPVVSQRCYDQHRLIIS
ncbi:hypothetical protein H6P81_020482 [Aristolochia fimbriata]|uniref:Uncharacterized protein n=1 Tax=Aristolochia fimbriata TaxID=158543 RepID=A0AAV7DUJ9_ARIFI|nr:hypothetical protein H6P81_020482 [Aristolochia fimbriata]